jgi:hypothetical protein
MNRLQEIRRGVCGCGDSAQTAKRSAENEIHVANNTVLYPFKHVQYDDRCSMRDEHITSKPTHEAIKMGIIALENLQLHILALHHACTTVQLF